jgi:hypothetical protein
MKEANTPGEGDSGYAKRQRQPLPPPGDAGHCHEPQAGDNEGPPFREQLCHKRLHTSLPRHHSIADGNGAYLERISENLSRLCVTGGLYDEFSVLDV